MIDLAVPPKARRAPARMLTALRQRLRTSELWLIALAIGLGVGAGLLAVLQARVSYGIQALLYGLHDGLRLSAITRLSPWHALWLPLGGLALGLFTWLARRWRPGALVDVVEANALHGGVLSLRDSLIVCGQTLISSGFGASVGLEAAYAQAGGAVGSFAGRRMRLRRHDLRVLLGAGAGAAIGAAFGAPLTGAFYAFEIVIGSYTPSAIAPVAAASLASVLTAGLAGGAAYTIHIRPTQSPDALAYLLYGALGLVCAVVGIGIMRLVGLVDRMARGSPIPAVLRPAVGGLLLGGVAFLSPQVLSAGHGALHLNLAVGMPLAILAAVFVLKTLASAVSLGFGFRGGLFFASLFLGTLLGQLFSGLIDLSPIGEQLSAENAALVGMGALAVAVVGGPLTMSFLVLESTRDFGVAAATLAASLVASTIVRERFGYSFSTWRAHLRGETIRSARDVGWVRTLTAGRMMRANPATFSAEASVAEFRRRFPLGSGSRVVLTDNADRYSGVALVADAYAGDVAETAPVREIAINADATLAPDMNITDVMAAFDATETEELAVVDEQLHVLGLLAETHVARRYASELERQQLTLYGED